MTVNLGETRWRMLRQALEYDVFCYHDLRQPSRRDVEHFEVLLDLGLFAPAPPGTTGTRRNTFAIKVGDPLGLFVVTDAGRKAAHMGFASEVPEGTPKPSLSIERRPADGKEGKDWSHRAAPPVPAAGTLYRTTLGAPPAVYGAEASPAPTADQYSPLVPAATPPAATPVPKAAAGTKAKAKAKAKPVAKPVAKKGGKPKSKPKAAAR